MRKIFVCLALLVANVAEAQIRRPTDVYYEEGGSTGGSIRGKRHAGGPDNLPYGYSAGWDPGIARHAETMPAVQYAMRRMEERGYTRRADLDAGVGGSAYSVAVLVYEKPGVPAGEALPVVTVITQPFYVSSHVRWVPATQVACGLFRDSSGVLIPTETPSDSAILVTGVSGTGAVPPGAVAQAVAGVGADRDYDEFAWRYTTYDQYTVQDWWGTMSPGNQSLWRQYGTQMAISVTSAGFLYGPGWVSPPPLGPGGGLYAMAVAACATHFRFWAQPPDTGSVP